MRRPFFVIASALCLPGLLVAAPITYLVTVDTSSISGTDGSLDFNFNPGSLVSQAASLQILNFTSGGTLAGNCPCGIGDVSGQLPATLTIDNGTGFNDYFDGFRFGPSLAFLVSLYGPALSAPDGVSTAGSSFAFSMFSDAAGTMPTLTNNMAEGFALRIDVNLDGTATVDNFSFQTTVVPSEANVPEPRGMTLLGLACLGLLLLRRNWRAL